MNTEGESVLVDSVPRALCTLIKYHAARLARDDDEWMCWGRMYVQMCAVLLSIHDFDVPRRRSEVLSDPVVTLEGEIDRADDSSQTSDRAWSLIRHNDEYLEEVIAYLGYQKNRETVKIVLGLIMSKNFEMGNYDARVRSIMRNIFRVVPLPPKYLFTLESQYSQQTGPFFNQADLCTLGSSVTPFRSLQVCAVALSTGLVMYGVGVFTAPAILMATQQLINTGFISTSMGQMLLGSGLVDAAAMTHLLAAMPELCNTAVAGASAVAGLHSASSRMLHRTSPLKEFVLSPLFLPNVIAKTCTEDYSRSCCLKKQSCLVMCEEDNHIDDHENNGGLITSSLVIIEEVEDLTPLSGLNPVYFLIPGHVGNETDLRGIFGSTSEVHDADIDDDSLVVNSIGEKLDTQAQLALEAVLEVVEEDVDKLSSLMSNSMSGHGGTSEELQFLTAPHLVRRNWWRDLFPRGEEYILQWERTELADLNKKIRNMLTGTLISHAVNAALAHFALTALWSSFSWANFILDEVAELDGPWAVALDRSKQAGRILARLILSNKFCQIESEEVNERSAGKSISRDLHSDKAEGIVVVKGDSFTWDDCAFENIRRGRPVTLIGYSMGARVIYHCLQELDACCSVVGRGIVENVVLMGAPVGTEYSGWSACRRVVSGRLINCYSRKDWFLALMYRSNMYEPTVAGLHPFSLIRSNKFGVEAAGYCYMAPHTVDAGTESLPTDHIVEVTQKIHSWAEDIECVDVSGIIKSHADYPNQLHAILEMINIEPPTLEPSVRC